MRKETRTIYYDEDLHIEAYFFNGIMQPFPAHFHDYYVIGLIEHGQRSILCDEKSYNAYEGNIILFNPNEKHSCAQYDNRTLDYRALNVSTDVLEHISKKPIQFSSTVIKSQDIASSLKKLHQIIMDGISSDNKNELFLSVISRLISEYSYPIEKSEDECKAEIDHACRYMESHYAECISLEQLCKLTSLSRATLMRSFAKAKGISPYRYLENIRLKEARKLLQNGTLPIDAAMQAGFSDQSHFTSFFKDYTGLTPKQYSNIFKER